MLLRDAVFIVILRVVMLSVTLFIVMLTVVMPSVVAPTECSNRRLSRKVRNRNFFLKICKSLKLNINRMQ